MTQVQGQETVAVKGGATDAVVNSRYARPYEICRRRVAGGVYTAVCDVSGFQVMTFAPRARLGYAVESHVFVADRLESVKDTACTVLRTGLRPEGAADATAAARVQMCLARVLSLEAAFEDVVDSRGFAVDVH